MSTRTVEMYVDPSCPWSWLTSRWLLEAERLRPIRVVHRIFSLAEVNREDTDKRPAEEAERVRAFFERADRALGVMVAARRAGGEEAIRAVYTELGEAHHERDEPLGEPEMLRQSLTAASLDQGLIDTASNDPLVREELLAEHTAAVERGVFGVASLSLDGAPPFFGPVVDRRVAGEEAGELWDVVAPLLANPTVFELKRPRTTRPDIGRTRMREAAAAAG